MSSTIFPTIPEAFFKTGTMFTNSSSSFHSHFTARLMYTAALPAFLVKEAIELIQRTIDLAGVVFTLSLWVKHNKRFFINLDSTFRYLLTRPYACVIKILNPRAKVPGYLIGSYAPVLKRPLFIGSSSSNFWVQHFATRASILVLLTFRTIQRVCYLTIGILGATLSILALGKSQDLNNWVFAKLESSVIIKEIILYSFLFLNPWIVPSEDFLKIKKTEPSEIPESLDSDSKLDFLFL